MRMPFWRGDLVNNAVKTIRWRLLAGALSLLAAVAITLPAAASRVDLGQRLAQIGPSVASDVADVIWPNAAELMDVIWPNAAVFGDSLSGTSDGS
jgi:hypothetical protein